MAAVRALDTAPTGLPRLLLGSEGPESWAAHARRLGPPPNGGAWLVDELAESGLSGKGGAGFPVWKKWAGLAGRSLGRAVVLVNASEGEPLSAKDKTLLRLRPHLVLDGAALAAQTVGATEIVLYVTGSTWPFDWRLGQVLRERRRARPREPEVRIVRTAHRYVAGESSAAARRASGERALPRMTPPHVSERGVFGRPTLVQNAETLAHAALIARFGAAWFRELGSESRPGSALVTLKGNVVRAGVYEVDPAQELRHALAEAGGTFTAPAGALIGGYFGTWVPGPVLPGLTLDQIALGCGVIAMLPADGCPLVESSKILTYLSRESAGQCGPCVHGLRALSDAAGRLARSEAAGGELDLVWRWSGQIKGRGACHHPDGAVAQLESVLAGFPEHVLAHAAGERCAGWKPNVFPAPPGGPR